ncbi:MAG: tetratricopeptide repeat protein [Phycisphaerae bacterium]
MAAAWVALAAATFLAYQPAWRGGLVWDDDAHVTRTDLRSAQGLWRIWTDLRATQQYYPLLHSAFWIEHKLWGDATLGYHLVNIALHVLAAFLAWVILRRLGIGGAFLAAAIFALHPVQVESVAWITELKNTLSAVFYLGAALAYLSFDAKRRGGWYALALALFVLGLMSKTVTATLPAALLVVFWFQRGRLSWRRDVLPLIPFFVLGAAAGFFTAWVERTLIGAQGADFNLAPMERCLIAGRAIWFYLGKLFWPSGLVFIYPRWQVSATVGGQYLFPVAAVALLAACWLPRRRTRGPLAAMLFFVGTLVPVLGFFNVYPFIYSFVADHFQYLASLGIIVAVSAGMATLLRRWPRWVRPAGYGLALALLATLWVLSWRQSRMYTDIERLYQTTIERNPRCWMAHNNLGAVLLDSGRVPQSIDLYQEALRLRPDYPEAHNNLGMALAAAGQIPQAIDHYQTALRLKPEFAEADYNLGVALFDLGQVQPAIDHYKAAVKLQPYVAGMHYNLGIAIDAAGRVGEAIAQYQEAIRLQPDYPKAHNNLGVDLAAAGRMNEAIAQYKEALRQRPDYPEAHNNLGIALAAAGRVNEAIAQYQEALRQRPDYAEAHNNLGILFSAIGRLNEAIAQYQETMRLKPEIAEVHCNLGIALAAAGRMNEALAQYQETLRLRPDYPDAHNNLGSVLCQLGQFSQAIPHFQEALRLRPDYPQARKNLEMATQALRQGQ